MSGGVHGKAYAADPFICRVSEAPEEIAVESVSRSVGAADDTAAVKSTTPPSAMVDDADKIFYHEQETVYRATHSFAEESRCTCELIKGHGCPVRYLEADCGVVVLLFVATDLEPFRDIVVNLKSTFDGVSLWRLAQSEPDSATGSLVFADCDGLTMRRRKVLETVHEMGYFGHPREANATEVIAALDTDRSTFTEHLSTAQSKLLDTIFDV